MSDGVDIQFNRPDSIEPPGGGGRYISRYGIYALDHAGGTYRDGGIRDYPFVTGFTWRGGRWEDIETADGVYDFTEFDHIVGRLTAIGKKLSWLPIGPPPAYIAQLPNVETWDNDGVLTPVPWDETLIDRYYSYIQALSNHTVGGVSLWEHPTLSLLHPQIPGCPRNGLRDHTIPVSGIPGYTRDKLVGAVVDVLHAFTDHFPQNPLHLSLWPINDGNTEPRLWERLAVVARNYYDAGLWMDNLSASRPAPGVDPVSGRPVPEYTAIGNDPRNGFQMLGSWTTPINPNHVPHTLNGTPMDGMQYGFNTYGARYFEVYASDLDNPEYAAGFTEWAARLADTMPSNPMGVDDGR